MTDFRVSEDRLPPDAIRCPRDLDEADVYFKRMARSREVASRKAWPPIGFLARIRWEWARATERRLS